MRLAVAVALAGAALLAWPARALRIDVIAERCDRWPPVATTLALTAAYLAALACLTVGWWLAQRQARRLWPTMAAAAVVHIAIIAAAPPFLSLDPLFYAAVGRATDPHHALVASLPSNDAILALLPATWQLGTSPYGAAWNFVCRAVAGLTGDITAELRIFQALAATLILAAAAVVGKSARSDDDPHGARAAALVAFSPLALVEATLGAHNDAVAVLAMAVAVWALGRQQRVAALAAQSVALAVKASAILPVVIQGLALVLKPLRLRPRVVVVLGAVALAVAAAVLVVAGVGVPTPLQPLLGGGEDWPHCTRAWECLPRGAVWLAGAHRASDGIGLAFRAAGGLWLLYAGARAAADTADARRWLVIGLTIYWLFFHGYLESWYFLPLLALMPFAAPWLRPALRTLCVTQVAYYAIRLNLACDPRVFTTAAKELSEGIVATLIPSVVLVRSYAAARSTGSASMR